MLQPTAGLGRYPKSERHYLAAFHRAKVAARPARAFIPLPTHAHSSESTLRLHSLSRFYALTETMRMDVALESYVLVIARIVKCLWMRFTTE